MADPLGQFRAFLGELKRRKVYRVTAVYVVVAIAGFELLDVVVPASRLPEWSDEFFLGLVILGLPIAVVLAWAFEVTPDGVRRTPDQAAGAADGPEDDAPSASDIIPEVPAQDAQAVAVLPFRNLSGTEEAEPFTAGLHDDLLTELSRVPALTVISRTSVLGYRDSGKTIPEIGRELGAGTVVEGGVQQSGNRVRLNVQLIDAQSDVHLWAERYDRELTAENIFDIQSELADRIARTLQAELTPEGQERSSHLPTADLDAYRLYAQGRTLFDQRSGDGMRRAADCFERAIERDSSYAPAWAGLAHALVMLADYGYVQPDATLPRGEEAALRALELDPLLPEAHAAMGNLHSARREVPEAILRQERAAELQPSYAQAHQWLNWGRLLLGRAESALESGKRATRLAPLEPEARGNLSIAHLGCGDAATALAEALLAQETHPDFAYTQWAEGLALHHLGQPEKAIEAMERLRVSEEPWTRGWPVTSRALAYAGAGRTAEARELLAELEDAPFHAGVVRAALGELDQAFEALRRAAPLHWSETLYVRYHPPDALGGLWDDPRYDELRRELDRSWGLEAKSPSG
jgi:TolB-like protein/Tfp pilus assembly protein PilF